MKTARQVLSEAGISSKMLHDKYFWKLSSKTNGRNSKVGVEKLKNYLDVRKISFFLSWSQLIKQYFNDHWIAFEK